LGKLGTHPVVRADDDAIESSVVLETFLRFKGLERPVIIVTDLHLAKGRADIGKRMHIALTRATTAVRVIDDEGSISADLVLGRLVRQ
jgi:superfamily I DNA and RNA helicase